MLRTAPDPEPCLNFASINHRTIKKHSFPAAPPGDPEEEEPHLRLETRERVQTIEEEEEEEEEV